MPTYEYACTKCGQHVEVFQRISEPPLTTCGVCGGPLRKVFHPAGIVFKGSGFYATDSRSKAEPASSESSPGSTSDAKPDTKGGEKKAGSKPAGEKAATGSAKEKSA
ncbi:MAG TPA: FmdB family zinc ribbon protein [Actinomycetota bacterium]|jgi:putative FmdB family regulatory protein|nr:FmdB family zinc ribbon protein [Actinomycetota bacterium]